MERRIAAVIVVAKFVLKSFLLSWIESLDNKNQKGDLH